MASIRFAEGQQRAGSSGGTVFSHNRFGAYIRPRTVPVNPSSARQSAVRATFASLTALWQGVTAGERAVWDSYAEQVLRPNRFGEMVALTGFNWYIALNSARVDAGLPILNDSPEVFTMGEPPLGIAVSGDISLQLISVAFTNTEDWADEGGALYIQQGLATNPTINFYKSPFRRLGVVLGDAVPPTSPQTFAPVFPISLANRTVLRITALYPDGRKSTAVDFTFFSVA